MGILGWILFGLVVGALAKLVMPGRDPGGIIVTMLIGIAGAVIGGFVGRAMGWYGEGEAAGFLMSFIGRSRCWRSTACSWDAGARSCREPAGGALVSQCWLAGGPHDRQPTSAIDDRPGFPLGRAHMLASTAIRDARRAGLPAQSITPLGSLRRFAPAVGDVSLLAVAAAAGSHEVLTGLRASPPSAAILARSASHITIGNERGAITLHVAVPEEAGSALVWHTGSRAHTSQLQDRAQRMGLTFDKRPPARRAGARRSSPRRKSGSTSTSGCRTFRRSFVKAKTRFAAAERGDLPTLVSTTDIRGDLHMHSTWSDGRDTIDQMVFAGQQLGYEYVAITDHSERSLASRQLAAADIARQRADIEKVRVAGQKACRFSMASKSTSCPTARWISTTSSWPGSTSCWPRCTITRATTAPR